MNKLKNANMIWSFNCLSFEIFSEIQLSTACLTSFPKYNAKFTMYFDKPWQHVLRKSIMHIHRHVQMPIHRPIFLLQQRFSHTKKTRPVQSSKMNWITWLCNSHMVFEVKHFAILGFHRKVKHLWSSVFLNINLLKIILV